MNLPALRCNSVFSTFTAYISRLLAGLSVTLTLTHNLNNNLPKFDQILNHNLLILRFAFLHILRQSFFTCVLNSSRVPTCCVGPHVFDDLWSMVIDHVPALSLCNKSLLRMGAMVVRFYLRHLRQFAIFASSM